MHVSGGAVDLMGLFYKSGHMIFKTPWKSHEWGAWGART